MHPTVSDLIAGNEKIQKQKSYRNLAEVLEEYCNPDYISHFSVVLARLSAAVQLDRRYISESLDKRLMMKAKLGRLYANAYRPDEARKYLLESEQMTVGTKYVYFLNLSGHSSPESDRPVCESNVSFIQKSPRCQIDSAGSFFLCMKLYVLPGRIIYFNPYTRTMLSNSVLSAKPSNTLWRLVPDCSLVTQSFSPASSGSLSIIVR